jgi:hypothetical protein
MKLLHFASHDIKNNFFHNTTNNWHNFAYKRQRIYACYMLLHITQKIITAIRLQITGTVLPIKQQRMFPVSKYHVFK